MEVTVEETVKHMILVSDWYWESTMVLDWVTKQLKDEIDEGELVDGTMLREIEGLADVLTEDLRLEIIEGIFDGSAEGLSLGVMEGLLDGLVEGISLGSIEGLLDEIDENLSLGAYEGIFDEVGTVDICEDWTVGERV